MRIVICTQSNLLPNACAEAGTLNEYCGLLLLLFLFGKLGLVVHSKRIASLRVS